MKIKKLRHSLIYGTALLFASNVLVKGLGFYYRIALVRLLGARLPETWPGLFLQMATHPLVSAAFAPEAKVKNECDILLADGHILRPDRYAELADKVLLLDYKTGKPEKEHHKQLGNYMTVLGRMVAKPIEGYLVYLGETVEVVKV